MAKSLQDDLTTLSGWVTENKMQLDIKKSSISYVVWCQEVCCFSALDYGQ